MKPAIVPLKETAQLGKGRGRGDVRPCLCAHSAGIGHGKINRKIGDCSGRWWSSRVPERYCGQGFSFETLARPVQTDGYRLDR